MAITVGTPVATATTPGTLNVSLPTYAAGDSMFVLCCAVQAGTATFAAITNWTTIKSERTSTVVAIGLYHRIMDGTEGSTLGVTTIGSNDVNLVIAWVDDELDGSDAIDVIGTAANTSTGSGALTVPGITAGTSKRLYGVWVGVDNDGVTSGTATGASAFTHPSGMTELFDAVTDEGVDACSGAAYLDGVTGATGDKSVTGTPASLSNYRCIGFLVSVNPAAGGPIEKDLTAATETDAAQVLVFTKTIFKTVAAGLETDAAQALSVSGPIILSLTAAAETGTAQALNVGKLVALTAGVETDTAGPIIPLRVIVPATETDTAVALTYSQAGSFSITPAAETDQAQTLNVTKTIFKTLTPATETGAAQAITYSQAGSYTIAEAAELDAAQALSITKTIFKTLGPVGETNTAAALSTGAIRSLSPALEVEQAVALGHTKRVLLVPGLETNAAQAQGLRKIVVLAPGAELDVALNILGAEPPLTSRTRSGVRSGLVKTAAGSGRTRTSVNTSVTGTDLG